MEGEELIIGKDFKKVAQRLKGLLLPKIKSAKDKFIISIAGESGAGKSGISVALSNFLAEEGIKNIIINQDDYFIYPPKENLFRRKKNIGWVGTSEIQLALLQENLLEIKKGRKEIIKPLVHLKEEKITPEKVSLEDVRLVIVEGTYASILGGIDLKIFINRTHQDTEWARIKRGREEIDEFIKSVLEIEHKIISLQKEKADILITKDFEVKEV